jgi:hypothetical protein
MRSETIAIDCDLRRLHAWGTGCRRVCYNAPLAQAIKHLQARRAAVTDLVVLFEIASPIVYDAAGMPPLERIEGYTHDGTTRVGCGKWPYPANTGNQPPSP